MVDKLKCKEFKGEIEVPFNLDMTVLMHSLFTRGHSEHDNQLWVKWLS